MQGRATKRITSEQVILENRASFIAVLWKKKKKKKKKNTR